MKQARGPASRLEEEHARTRALYAEESALYAAGYKAVAGVDEAGRGCLAGPVHAGAAVLFPSPFILGLNDSKLLSPGVRAGLADRIHRSARAFAVGSASPCEIDRFGIVEATARAMMRALEGLEVMGTHPDIVLVDGAPVSGLPFLQRNYIKGDGRIAAIAAASILAKTARDMEMDTWHARLPFYGFDSNRGYGTRAHLSALSYHGPSVVHRFTFDRVLPVKT